jgi:hypothetical protein
MDALLVARRFRTAPVYHAAIGLSNGVRIYRNQNWSQGTTRQALQETVRHDSRPTVRNRSVEEEAIDALNAGSDYLLLAAIDDQLERVVAAICEAVEKRELAGKRLSEARSKIRVLSKKYGG